jgi:hypothetical protein
LGARTAPGVCTQNLEIKNKKPATRFSTRRHTRHRKGNVSAVHANQTTHIPTAGLEAGA